jgi:flagellar biosynthesis component FlhA
MGVNENEHKTGTFIITLLAVVLISFMAYLIFPLPTLLLWIVKIALAIGIPLSILGIAILIYEAYQYLGQ